eukprot:scaffold675_cov103-Cylindrotheca_fusiformis.AAC.10
MQDKLVGGDAVDVPRFPGCLVATSKHDAFFENQTKRLERFECWSKKQKVGQQSPSNSSLAHALLDEQADGSEDPPLPLLDVDDDDDGGDGDDGMANDDGGAAPPPDPLVDLGGNVGLSIGGPRCDLLFLEDEPESPFSEE